MRSALLALLLGSPGCEPVSRVRECRRFTDLVNAAQQEADASAQPGKAAGFRKAAERYHKLLNDLQKLQPSHPAAKGLQDEYATFLRSSIPAVGVYADALDSKDPQRIEDAHKPIVRLQNQGHNIAARFNAFCQGR